MYSIVFFLMSLHALIAVDPQYVPYRLDENMVTKVSDFGVAHDVYVIGVKQYGSSPYCILPSSVLQYIAILQYMTRLC